MVAWLKLLLRWLGLSLPALGSPELCRLMRETACAALTLRLILWPTDSFCWLRFVLRSGELVSDADMGRPEDRLALLRIRAPTPVTRESNPPDELVFSRAAMLLRLPLALPGDTELGGRSPDSSVTTAILDSGLVGRWAWSGVRSHFGWMKFGHSP